VLSFANRKGGIFIYTLGYLLLSRNQWYVVGRVKVARPTDPMQ
jgi:hypothetical protein